MPLENKVLHPDIYTKVDALYGLGDDGFFIRLICKPGSSPSDIRMQFVGHTALSIQTDGSLRVETMLEDLILAKPTAVFSDASGTESAAGWTPDFVVNNDGTVSFSIGTVPSGSSLIVKTGRDRGYGENECDFYWSTYFGETGNEKVKGSDVDAAGNMYFTGNTTSTMFPVLNAIQNVLKGETDAFVACFRQLDEQKWATFYGGIEPVPPSGLLHGDDALAIKWNPQNNFVYIVGRTPAADFPLEPATGYYNNQVNSGVWDSRGFIVKLEAESGERSWATFFGDSEKKFDAVTALHIRNNGNVVVGGYSHQTGNTQTAFPFLPTTPSAIPHIQTQGALYVAEFDLSNAQVWATKLANELQLSTSPVLADIGEIFDGQLYVIGNVPEDGGNDFIPTGSGSMGFSGVGPDVFLIEFSQAKELTWSTYLGGNSFDIANSVIATLNGVVVTGSTQSDDFPVAPFGDPGNHLINDLSLEGFSDIFVSEFVDDDFGGNVLFWSRYLGGPGGPSGADSQPTISHNNGDDGSVGNATTILGQGEFAITGTVENNFAPLTPTACPYFYSVINRVVASPSGRDAVIVIIKSREITFSTYWGGDTPGGTNEDVGNTISKGINPNETAFVLVGGHTNSKKIAGQGETIPVCRELPFPDSYYNENFLGGGKDAFISKIYYGECLTSAVTSPLGPQRTLEIQPNPASDFTSIKLPELGKDGANIILFDATGKVVANIPVSSKPATEPSITVEMASFPSGLYFVNLHSSGRTYSGKFVKI